MEMEPKEWLLKKEAVLKDEQLELLVEQAIKEEEEMLKKISSDEVFDYMVSRLNFCRRKSFYNNPDVRINVGDICYIDFGNAYLQESGYQHMGLVLSLVNNKAFVVPMTSNGRTVRNAKSKRNPNGSIHVLRIGKPKGLIKPSALFLNDAKWINTSRIIDVKGHISTKSNAFQYIRDEVKKII